MQRRPEEAASSRTCPGVHQLVYAVRHEDVGGLTKPYTDKPLQMYPHPPD